jgi:hypothetical protein
MRQADLFGLLEPLKWLSDCGDPLETMSRVVDIASLASRFIVQG